MSQTTELLLRIRQIGGEQLQQLGRSLNKLGQQATDANQDFKSLSVELANIQSTSAKSINNLRGYANSWRQIANSVEIGTAEFKQATAEAAKLEAQLAKTEGRRVGGGRLAGIAQTVGTVAGAGVFGGPEGALGAAIGSIGGVPGAITGGAIGAQVGQLRQALGSTAEYVAEIRKLQIALQGVAGSQEEYSKALQIADRATRQLNVPQEVAIQGMTKLTAAVKGAGGQVSDAGIVFTNITKAIKGTGGSAEDVQGAITAMVQVFSKGKVSAEELSGQLGERLPGAVTLFAKANKMTLPELQKGLKEGQIGLNELMRFIQLLGTEYGMTALKIAASSEDAGARLRVSFNDMRLAVGAALQPIGAELQGAFAAFIKDITPAVIASVKAIAAGVKFLLDNASNISALVQFAATFATVTFAINNATKAIQIFVGLQGVLSTFFLAMQAGFANTTARAVAAEARLIAFGATVKALARSLAGPIVLTVAIIGAQVVIDYLNRIKNAQDGIKKANQELKGRSWLKSIGGDATDIATLKTNTKIAGDTYTYYAKKVAEGEAQLETLRKKPFLLRSLQDEARQNRLALEVAADKARRDSAMSKFLAASGATRAKGEETVTDFKGPEADGAGGETKKEKAGKKIVDITIQEFNIRKQLAELRGKENPLQEAFLNYKLQEIKIANQLRDKQIGARDAQIQQIENQDKLNEAIDQQRKTSVDFLIEYDRLSKLQKVALEDVQVQYGLITRQQAEQLKFDREIARLRESAKGTSQVQQTEEVIEKLKKARELAATFGGQLSTSFFAGIKSMGDIAQNLGQSLANVFSGLADVVAEFVTTGKASFADFTRSVLADLAKIFVRAAFFNTLKAIIPGGSFLGGLFNFATGGIMTAMGPMPLKRYAGGGIANSPQLAMFGEGRQPEAYVPLPDGRSIPVTMQGGGQGVNVVVNVDAAGSAVQGDGPNARALGVAISSAVKAEILKQQRPGGYLAGTR